MIYLAYGSNINLRQMKYRCPHSKVIGTAEIKDYELEFRGVATIVPKNGASVPILVWDLDKRDLPVLNKYEGHPHLYRQEKLNFLTDGKSKKGMAYLMNRGRIDPPSRSYYNTILEGYRENGLDVSFLRKALENSYEHERIIYEQDMSEEDDEDEDYDEVEDCDEDYDEDEGLDFLDGFQLKI